MLAEPALTNIGIVLPDPGYHEALRDLTRATGTLLVIDETHTICAGPGGCHRGLGPRARLPGHRQDDRRRHAGRGLRHDGRRRRGSTPLLSAEDVDIGGVGGTLTGNALAVAAMKATLSTTLTRG